MSNDLKQELMQALCHDLSNEEVERLIETIREKLTKGFNVEEIAGQLLTAITQVVILAAPDLTDEEVLDISEDIGDALIDRVLEYAGHEIEPREEVPPHDQLN